MRVTFGWSSGGVFVTAGWREAGSPGNGAQMGARDFMEGKC